eukprot:CAMPEP_0201660760 /NCGR_PEP_ID=MMETSP0494-20130426/3319_1 /ASSEMBLY_ACC=CAM_ASM_000839 /TAXON_ID=420259 /ORGANISM="Thalassiosira gravida, Strain GMp14c1" /LENGTH=345 /DNA_ID=CAMNT_0048138713 /DNA_START=105 /DNA_END=1142 /DNA_ORIENTATION=+
MKQHPPPQYILPPVMGNVGSRSIIGELTRMRSSGSDNNSHNSNSNNSNNNNTTANDDESQHHDHHSHTSETSDAENIMSRGNVSSSNNDRNDPRRSKRSLKKEVSSRVVVEASVASGSVGSVGLGGSAVVVVEGEEERLPTINRHHVEARKITISEGFEGVNRNTKSHPPPIRTTIDDDYDDDHDHHYHHRNASAVDQSPQSRRNDSAPPSASTLPSAPPATPPTEEESIHSDEDDDDITTTATPSSSRVPSVPDIRIGRTGNPIGSLGYPLSLEQSCLDVVERKKESEDADAGSEDDDVGECCYGCYGGYCGVRHLVFRWGEKRTAEDIPFRNSPLFHALERGG